MADEDVYEGEQLEDGATTQYLGKLSPELFDKSYKLLVNDEGTALRLKGKSSKPFGVNGTPEGRKAKAQRVFQKWASQHLDAPTDCDDCDDEGTSSLVIKLFDRRPTRASNQHIASCSGNSILFHLGSVFEVKVS
jgi:hypothetical protein